MVNIENLVDVHAEPFRANSDAPAKLVEVARRALEADEGLQRDMPDVATELEDEMSARLSALIAQQTGERRYVVVENGDSIGMIRLADEFRHPRGRVNDVRGSGVDLAVLGARVEWWINRSHLGLAATTPIKVARLAVGLAQFERRGHPWAILSSEPDGPCRELKLPGAMDRFGPYRTDWCEGWSMGGDQYALYAATGIIGLRRDQDRYRLRTFADGTLNLRRR